MTTWMAEIHQRVITSGDPLTNQWALIPSPLPSICYTGIYVTISVLGPIWIKPGKLSLAIKPYVLMFNVVVVMTALYLCKEILVCAYLAEYSLTCEPLDETHSPLAIRMGTAFWYLYLLRFATGLDTVFFILLKKSHKISLRHIIHHASTPIATWITVKYGPGGQVFLHSSLTAIVHVIVYSYAAALCYPSTKKYALPIGKYIPALHFAHLCIVIVHSLLGISKDCFQSDWLLVAMAAYCFVLAVLQLLLGEAVLLLDLVAAYWPRCLGRSRIVAQMKSQKDI